MKKTIIVEGFIDSLIFLERKYSANSEGNYNTDEEREMHYHIRAILDQIQQAPLPSNCVVSQPTTSVPSLIELTSIKIHKICIKIDKTRDSGGISEDGLKLFKNFTAPKSDEAEEADGLDEIKPIAYQENLTAAQNVVNIMAPIIGGNIFEGETQCNMCHKLTIKRIYRVIQRAEYRPLSLVLPFAWRWCSEKCMTNSKKQRFLVDGAYITNK